MGFIYNKLYKFKDKYLSILKNQEKINTALSFQNLQRRHKEALSGCSTHILEGFPSLAIASFVKSEKIDLIVMGTLARACVQGFIIGNTAESIVNQVDCSIMAIKPDGFISPIMP